VERPVQFGYINIAPSKLIGDFNGYYLSIHEKRDGTFSLVAGLTNSRDRRIAV
jgi:hypothetical protein